MSSVDDDFEEKDNTKSTSTSLKGGDINCIWNQIGTLAELNSKIDGIRSFREYTKSENCSHNDGGFCKQDDVLFFSKIDNQYIPGVIKDKKKDKLTKDYIYKIEKIHKRDEEVDEELSGKKRSAKEDPRVEIIKLRQERAKKLATITWNTKKKTQESYYKIMSANDYQIELQLSLLKILKTKVIKVINKRKKTLKLSRQATKIGENMIKSQQKRDKKQRVAQTFSGTRQQMIDMSRKQKSKSKSKSRNNGKQYNKRGKHTLNISSCDSFNIESDDSINNINNDRVLLPNGNPKQWTQENVLIWLQFISQNECQYENDRKLKLSDEERKNFKIYRSNLFDNYFEKFINAEIDGKKLFKLNNVSLRSKVYMNNAIEKKIVIKCLDELFGNNRNSEIVDASKYIGTEYDFSRDWKKSNIAELKWQKKKQAAGNLSKMRVIDIGKNTKYKGTEWTQDIEESISGDIYGYKANKASKHESFMQRKAALGGILRHQTVSEIGIVENYQIPEYADRAIADTMIGQATDERSISTGIDIEGDNRQLMKILLHANVPIPAELTTPVKGYHTIQNRNAQLRNLLLKHQALLDDDEIAKNPELQRAMKLKETRKKFEQEQEKRELEALKKGDIKQITKTYGNKHKKIKQIKEAMKQHEKEEKRLKTGRKYRQRHQQNMSSLAIIKKRKKKIKSTSLALNDINEKYKNKNNKNNKSKKGHLRKRSSSIDNTKLNIIKDKNKNKNKNKKQKRPLSANTRRSNTVVGFSDNKQKKNKKKDKKDKKNNNRKVSFNTTPSYNTTPSRDSNISDATLILSPTAMQLGYDASTEIGTPLNNINENDYIDHEIDDDNDILIGIQRMHSTKADSMVIHSRINSLSLETSWTDNNNNNNNDTDSSEITFSDDDDDNDDDNNNDNNTVPLSIQRLRAQEKNNKLPRIMSHISDE